MTRNVAAAALAAAIAAGLAAPGLSAQTDFYNLDKDRPLRVEDAYATKRYAFELKVAPLTLAQTRDRTLEYRPEVELKHGLLPGLDVSAGLKSGAVRPTEGGTRRADTELELSSLLNLTTETRFLPGLGLRVTGHVPVEGDHGSVLEVKALATRSLVGPVRAHVNGGWFFGEDAQEEWWAGLAFDYVFPFRHMLILVETYISEPAEQDPVGGGPDGGVGAEREAERRIHSTAGMRYQVSPNLALDAGVGRSWAGEPATDWLLTLGVTYEFAVRALMPGTRR